MDEILILILRIILALVIPPLAIHITQLLKAGYGWLKSKTQNDEIKRFLTEVEAASANAVEAVQQMYVAELKKNNAFTAEAQREALTKALHIILQSLSAEAVEYIETSSGSVEEFLIPYIESAVLRQKKTA